MLSSGFAVVVDALSRQEHSRRKVPGLVAHVRRWDKRVLQLGTHRKAVGADTGLRFAQGRLRMGLSAVGASSTRGDPGSWMGIFGLALQAGAVVEGMVGSIVKLGLLVALESVLFGTIVLPPLVFRSLLPRDFIVSTRSG